jgi:hypothetical protein
VLKVHIFWSRTKTLPWSGISEPMVRRAKMDAALKSSARHNPF